MKNYKKNIIIGITILFLITMLFPAFEAQSVESNIVPKNNISTRLSTHTVLGEEGTATWCGYCPTVMQILDNIYSSGMYDFYYVALVADMNTYANSRRIELGITGYPTVAYDGGYTSLVGAGYTQAQHEAAITACGARTVANVDLDLSLYWLGSNQIGVSADVTNNGGSTYNGHLHVYITEKNSRWWNGGLQYHFAMIGDYGINLNVNVGAGATETYTNTWTSPYSDITIGNIKGIASVYASSPQYTDEVATADPQYPNSNPPTTPSTPSGPSSGFVGIPYTFSTSSTEPNGDSIKYGWDWDGDGDVDYWTSYYPSGQTAEATTSWDSVGTYNIKVMAKDEFGTESGWSSAKQIQIGLGDPPNTPSTPNGPDNGMHKTLYTYSTSTTDPNSGDLLFYKFDWGDGSTSQWLGPYDSGETISTNHMWNNAGTFDIKVKAKDAAGSETTWSNAKSVTMGNTPPNKPVKPSGPTSGSVGIKYKYSTSTSDPENDELEYFFYWGDNTDSGWVTTKYAEHIWLRAGEFGVKVKARDKWDESEWSQASTVTIEAGSLIVDVQAQPNKAVIGDEIQFSSTVTGGKEPYTFNWDLGDGNTSDLQNFKHIYNQVGNFTVSLSVQDSVGAYGSSYTIVNIDLTNAPDKPILLNGPESAIIDQSCDFTFKCDDPDFDNIQILVDWGDGTENVWEGPFGSGNDILLNHIWENEGIYTIQAKAKDKYNYESEWSEEYEITIGWQEAFIIGKLDGKEEGNDTSKISVYSITYITKNPFSIKRYNSGEIIVISNDYKGILSNKFILGKFKTGYI